MIRYLEAVLGSLTNASMKGAARSLIDPGRWLGDDSKGPSAFPAPPEAVLAAAFLARLAGPTHALFERATAVLDAPPAGSPDEIVAFMRRGVSRVRDEIERVSTDDPAFAGSLVRTAGRLDDPALEAADRAEACWALFFPCSSFFQLGFASVIVLPLPLLSVPVLLLLGFQAVLVLSLLLLSVPVLLLLGF